MSVNSTWPNVHKHLVMPLFGNGFYAITLLFFVVDQKESHFEISEFFYVSICKFSIFMMVT